MKLASITLAAGLVLTSTTSLLAAHPAPAAKSTKPATIEKHKRSGSKHSGQHDVLPLTGSHLKRDIRREGLIAVGPNPVYIMDSDSIRNSGATDVSELLFRRGFRR